MSKLVKFIAAAVLIAGTLAVTLDSADARRRSYHYYYFGIAPAAPPNFGFGIGVRYGYRGPYPYYGPYTYYRPYPYYYQPHYYAPPRCQRIYVRKWSHGRRVWRRAVRCW